MNVHPETFTSLQTARPGYTGIFPAAICLLLIGLLLIAVPCSAAEETGISDNTTAVSQTPVPSATAPAEVTAVPTDQPVTGRTTVPVVLSPIFRSVSGVCAAP